MINIMNDTICLKILMNKSLLFISSFCLCLFSFSVSASVKITQQIADLSAASLYHIDNEELPNLLKNILIENSEVKALSIQESNETEIFFTFFRENKQFIYNQPIPQWLTQFKKDESDIYYKNKLIGKLIIYFKNDIKIQLSKQEEEWLNKNLITKIGMMEYWPHDSNSNSLHTEVLKLINKYSGTNLVPVKYSTWGDGYSRAVKGDELHGIMGLSWSKAREENYFYYTPAYNYTPSYLVTRKDELNIKFLEDLNNKTIYLEAHSITHNLISERSPDAKIIDKNNIDDIYMSLSSSKEASAMVAEFINKDTLTAYDLKVVKEIYSRYGEASIGINHKYPELASIIDKAFKVIPKKELSLLRDKDWAGKDLKDKNILSINQRQYLKNKKTLNICTNPNWEPIEFRENELEKGISIDILKIIQEQLDLEYNYVKTSTWKQSQKFLEEKKCDILPSAITTEERKKYANFTSPYLKYDLAIITTADKPLTGNLKSITSKTMSRKKSSGLISRLKKKYPYIKIKETKNHQEALQEVIDGSVYFTITTVPVFSYYKSKYGLKNLQVAGYTDIKYNLSIAVRKDDKTLLDILNKLLQSVPGSTYDVVHDKWASVKVVKQTNWMLVMQISGVIIIILLFVVWNNRKLKSMVDKKTIEITKLLSSFDKNVIASKTNIDGIIIYASEALCNVSGYSESELIGKPQNIFRHPDMPQSTYTDLWSTIKSGKQWRGEIKNLKKTGGFFWVDAVISPDYDLKNNVVGYSAIRHDITSKKEVEDLTANLEKKIAERTADLSEAKKEVEIIHQHTRESIEYASLIQSAIIPDNEIFKDYFHDFFSIWQPKDIVGGDIFFADKLRHKDELLLMVIDCTGHGVPGAFVTMLVKAVERQVIAHILNCKDSVSPAKLLMIFNKSIKNLLQQETVDSVSNAGFDGSILYYNKKQKQLKFSGAESTLFLIQNNTLKTIKGNRHSIGYKKSDPDYEFTEHTIDVSEETTVYLTSDGYLDQTGGTKGFPFGKKRFTKLLIDNQKLTFAEQKKILISELRQYQADEERNDDVTVLGLRV